MIRVLLADDQALIRAGFRVLVDAAEDLQVIGEATDGQQAVDLARRQRADVVLMDIRMPGVDGLEATRRISAEEDLAGVKVSIAAGNRRALGVGGIPPAFNCQTSRNGGGIVSHLSRPGGWIDAGRAAAVRAGL